LLALIPVVLSYCLAIACENGARVLARCLEFMGRDRYCVIFGGLVDERNANPNLIKFNLKHFIAMLYCWSTYNYHNKIIYYVYLSQVVTQHMTDKFPIYFFNWCQNV